MEIWGSQSGVASEILATTGITAEEIAAIGITNQRETTIVWEKQTGKPVYNAIVWQCRRTAEYVMSLKPGDWKNTFAKIRGSCLTLIFPELK